MSKIHLLRIFHNKTTQKATLKKPVVNEHYDEIVFCEPTEFFYHMLTDESLEIPKSLEEHLSVLPTPVANEGENEENKVADADVKMEEVKQDSKEEAGDEVYYNSTYDVIVGPNDEQTVNIEQFFENYDDKKQLKTLQEALKILK